MGRSTDGMQTIPATVTEPILAIARDETDNQSVRQQALSVLGRLDHGAGIMPLVALSEQTNSVWLAKESMLRFACVLVKSVVCTLNVVQRLVKSEMQNIACARLVKRERCAGVVFVLPSAVWL